MDMTNKDIKFLEIRYLNGPSIWTYRPVIEAVVDIGELEDFPSNKIPGFYERLKTMLPSLIEHRCSYGERGGFLRRLEEGTWPAHILEHVTLELQNLAGLPGGFGKAREAGPRGVYKVVVRAWQEDVTRAALFEARQLVLAAMADQPFDVNASIAKLAELVDAHYLGPSTACIVEAADMRKIPYIRLLRSGNLVQLGHGAALRRIWTAETDQTSAIAVGISHDKDLTKTLLENCGVPVPEGREVDSPEDAWEAAQDIGLPVCVKPLDANHGRGVFIDIKTREEIEKAYAAALEEGNGVIVERSIPGNEHRLLVIGGKLIAANRGDAAQITGDGKSTVRELVETQINCDPRRGVSENHPLAKIDMDPAVHINLARQNLTPDSIPDAGRKVLIQRNANHEFDVTDAVHPETAEIAALATRIVGLDIAGIDLVCQDISKPLAEQGGAIVEVNAGPGLLMHLKPGVGKPRPVGQAIVDHLFADGNGRIPVVGVTGSYGKTTVCRLVARLLSISGKRTGLACSDGLFIDRRLLEKGDRANWDAAHRTLLNRAVEAAVFENGSDTILESGVAYDRCQVGVITNIDPARHIGRRYTNTPEQVFNIMRTQVDLVLKEGAAVLNAREPMLIDMIPLCDGEIILFADDPDLAAISAHQKHGGRAVFVRHGHIMLADHQGETKLVSLEDVPLCQESGENGQPAAQTENVLAAVAAAWALGLSHDVMRIGIETFLPD